MNDTTEPVVNREIRGGAWSTLPPRQRASDRSDGAPAFGSAHRGIRCVRRKPETQTLLRSIRGGSWDYRLWYARASYRDWYAPEDRFEYLGLRCVQRVRRYKDVRLNDL